ncbi:DNA polymerase IV [Liquorilactobacillus capillatus]|uniref:DNA polymerase IV n=1 Tax=Liquorilactobacillus capillatus TaxID=480931 RepID=UPI00070F6DF1|nr:DNA polymerase IV [Liquorilactobacillus capillatus]
MKRKIIHVDMDAFYASIEMRDHEQYRNKPLVIARDPRHTGGRGVVTTANYTARHFGIHSAMSAQEAYRLCHQAVFVKPDFAKYKQVSSEIHTIFYEYTDKVEPIAFDEAYLDVTSNKYGLTSALRVAKMIQQEIFSKTHLTCSTGVSYNKFLAKLASDYHKPAGVTLVLPEEVHSFLGTMPIEKFRGVGKKTAPKMHQLGIKTGNDLLKWNEVELIAKFGKIGQVLYQRVRGIDERPVEWKRKRKSIGFERTLGQPLKSSVEVDDMLHFLAAKLAKTIQQKQKHGKTLVLKLRNSQFETVTKRMTFDDYLVNDKENYAFWGRQLFDQIQPDEVDVRLLGLTLTNIDELKFENIKLPLWKK